ncbi:MAG: putative toxin-antitoxin system toxin component, PIN family [Saprospiraceae bacterium]|nr:putative toxin-antitoxin system toxin component, PIN family [Saprospiraceae bacterium]MDZ4704415.1 putative toxin-antitoxin system toxin component, PIN family [Saprospiraceae bacterium]
MLRVVLDTNIILASISPHSPFRLVIDRFEQGAFILCLTTDILLEYEEKLSEKFNRNVADLAVGGMLLKTNVQFAEVFFKWQLIYPDMDDNKFADCAIASNVHYLVTNDRDFNRLKTIAFPQLTVVNMEQFLKILQEEV